MPKGTPPSTGGAFAATVMAQNLPGHRSPRSPKSASGIIKHDRPSKSPFKRVVKSVASPVSKAGKALKKRMSSSPGPATLSRAAKVFLGATADGVALNDDSADASGLLAEEIYEARRRASSTIIALWYRGILKARRERARARYATMDPTERRRAAAIEIQRRARGFQAKMRTQRELDRLDRERFLRIRADSMAERERVASAVKLQAVVRGRLGREWRVPQRLAEVALEVQERAQADADARDAEMAKQESARQTRKAAAKEVAREAEIVFDEAEDPPIEDIVTDVGRAELSCVERICGCCLWTSKSPKAGRRRRRRSRSSRELEREQSRGGRVAHLTSSPQRREMPMVVASRGKFGVGRSFQIVE
jgi:hypothetical protein